MLGFRRTRDNCFWLYCQWSFFIPTFVLWFQNQIYVWGCNTTFKSINSFRKPHESSLRQFKAWKIAQLGNCKSLTIKLVGEIVCHFLLAIFLLNSLAMSQNQAWPNLHNTSFVCNIIFVILTCFHLEKKIQLAAF